MDFYERYTYLPIPNSFIGKINEKESNGIKNEDNISYLHNLKKVNIFIGKNNSGKSYFLREVIKDNHEKIYFSDKDYFFILEKIEKFKTENSNLFQKFKGLKSHEITPNNKINCLEFHYPNANNYFDEEHEIFGNIEFVKSVNENYNDLKKYLDNLFLDYFETIKRVDTVKFRNGSNMPTKDFTDFTEFINMLKTNFQNFENELNRVKFLGNKNKGNSNLNKIYIHNFRSLNLNTLNQTTIYNYIAKTFTGKEDASLNIENNQIKFNTNSKNITYFEVGFIARRLQSYLQNDQKSFKQYLNFCEFIGKEFYNGKEFFLVVRNENSSLDKNEIFVKIGDEEERPIYQLGTGIQMLIMMLYVIYFYDEGMIFIEEPELYLHPDFQKKFINLLTTNDKSKNNDRSKNFQFFIATHSNHIFDSLNYNDKVSLYTIDKQLDEQKQDLFTIKNYKYEDTHALDLLGVTYSSMAIANGIIWVEGPSDRIYIKKWIEVYMKEKYDFVFQEGLHYQIMFYGGSLIKHLSLNSNNSPINNSELDDLVNLLNINSNVIFVADRDNELGNEDEKLKSVLKNFIDRIQVELKEKIWITYGREIEHYLTQDLLNFLFDETELKLDDTKAFSDFLKENHGKIKAGKKSLFDKKVGAATEISQHIYFNSITQNQVLLNRIENLINEICHWNKLDEKSIFKKQELLEKV